MVKANRYGIEVSIATWAGGLCCLALAALALTPLRVLEAFPSFCPFRRLLGIECYGCGMTRALCALLHGQVDTALHYNRGVLARSAAHDYAGAVRRHAPGDRRDQTRSRPSFRLAFAVSWVIATMITTGCAAGAVGVERSADCGNDAAVRVEDAN